MVPRRTFLRKVGVLGLASFAADTPDVLGLDKVLVHPAEGVAGGITDFLIIAGSIAAEKQIYKSTRASLRAITREGGINRRDLFKIGGLATVGVAADTFAMKDAASHILHSSEDKIEQVGELSFEQPLKRITDNPDIAFKITDRDEEQYLQKQMTDLAIQELSEESTVQYFNFSQKQFIPFFVHPQLSSGMMDMDLSDILNENLPVSQVTGEEYNYYPVKKEGNQYRLGEKSVSSYPVFINGKESSSNTGLWYKVSLHDLQMKSQAVDLGIDEYFIPGEYLPLQVSSET